MWRALSIALLALAVIAGCSGESTFGDRLRTGHVSRPITALDGDGCHSDNASTPCECDDGAAQACYDGPPKHAGVGACVKGVKHCVGGVWSGCQDFVAPSDEACGDRIDNDCDGKVDEGCQCVPGTKVQCYSGPAETKGVGPCRGGEQTCAADGHYESVCHGEVIPSYEIITNSIDDNCDGVSELPTHCIPGTELPCYTGRADTLAVGAACSAGRIRCNDDGGGWSQCLGQTLPQAEVCDGLDNDCDGVKDEGLNCGWLRYVGTQSEDTPYDATSTSDGGVVVVGDTVTLSFTRNGFVTKLAAAGNTVWSQAIYNTQDSFVLYGVAEAADGGVWVVGRMDPLIAADSDTLIVKLTNTGALAHAHILTGWNLDEASAVTVLNDGGAVIVGMRDGGATGLDPFILKRVGTTTAWARSIAMTSGQTISDVAAAPDGGFVVVGCTTDFGAGGNDVFVTKWDAAGTLLWVRGVGGTLSDCALGANVATDGSVFVAANTNSFGAGFNDAYVVKLSSTGALLWARTIGTPDYQDAQSVAPASDGGAFVTGRLRPAAGGDDDIGVWKLGPAGDLQWARRIGDPAMIETPQAVALAPSGLFVAGQARVVPMGGGSFDYQTVIAQLGTSGGVTQPCMRVQTNAGNVAAANGTLASPLNSVLTITNITGLVTASTPTLNVAASTTPNAAVCGPP